MSSKTWQYFITDVRNHVHHRRSTEDFARIDDCLGKEEAPWHFVLYRLYDEDFEGKPEFLSRLKFDWGGPFPKCKELSRYLQFLHLTGCVGTVNPSYERMVLKPELRDLWCTEAEALPRPVQHFMKQALEVAKKEFSNYSVAV